MPNRTKSVKKPDINSDVSEYVWDIKTKRFKHNPDYHTGNVAAHYILWGAIILIMLIAIIWCLRWA